MPARRLSWVVTPTGQNSANSIIRPARQNGLYSALSPRPPAQTPHPHPTQQRRITPRTTTTHLLRQPRRDPRKLGDIWPIEQNRLEELRAEEVVRCPGVGQIRISRSGEDVEIGSFVAAESFSHPMFLDRPFRRSRSRARRSLSVGLGCRRGCQTSNGSEHNHASDGHPPHPPAERLGHVRGDPRGSSTPRRPLDAWHRGGTSPPPTLRAASLGISP